MFTDFNYLREKQVLEIIPIHRTTLWRWVKEGRFPQPKKIAPGVTIWSRAEVITFFDGRDDQ